MAKAIKALLFDKDGTLFDFHATWSAWCDGFIQGVSDGNTQIEIDLSDVMDFDRERKLFRDTSPIIAGTIDEIFAPIHRILSDWDREKLFNHMLDTAATAPQRPVVPLDPLLNRFRAAELKLGVATNDNEAPARAHLDSVSVLHHFDFVSGCDSGFGAKPEPGMLLGFCEAIGIAPSEVAMVGDSTHDLHAGRAAGMVNIGVLTGPAKAEALSPYADIVLPNIGAIPEWLGLK